VISCGRSIAFCVIFKSNVLMLSKSYSKPIVQAFVGVSFGVCHAMSWVICVLLGGKASGECGLWSVLADIHYYIIPLLCKCLYVYNEICRRSANLCIHVWCTIRMCFGQLLIMVFCLDNASLPLVAMFCTVCVDLMLLCLTLNILLRNYVGRVR